MVTETAVSYTGMSKKSRNKILDRTLANIDLVSADYIKSYCSFNDVTKIPRS